MSTISVPFKGRYITATGTDRAVTTIDFTKEDRTQGEITGELAKLAEERELGLRDSFAQAGVDALELSTDSDLLDALLRFAELRELRSRATSGGGVPAHLEARQTREAGRP